MDYDDMSLGELFAESDRVGDKYLTQEEVHERNWQLYQANKERTAELLDEMEQTINRLDEFII